MVFQHAFKTCLACLLQTQAFLFDIANGWSRYTIIAKNAESVVGCHSSANFETTKGWFAGLPFQKSRRLYYTELLKE